MSDQEMQFADPEWQPPRQRQHALDQEPYAPQPVNGPSRERTSFQQTPHQDEEAAADNAEYAGGYRAQEPGYQYTSGTPRMSGRPRRKHSLWFWIILIIILATVLGGFPFEEDSLLAFPRLLGSALGFAALALIVVALILFLINRSRSAYSSTSADTETRSFSVGSQPKIIIKDDVGAIRVHPGGENYQVIIQATRRAHGWLIGRDPVVQYDQDSEQNRITARARSGWSVFGWKSLDFDITVPRMSDLELKTDAGSIAVTGITGQMSCSSDAGSVKATEVALRGDSRLKTDAGSITFAGSLDPSGSYQMTTDAGSINLYIPENTSFQLEAKTDVGSINSDFPVNVQRDFPGGKARGEVGMPPYATLKLRTDVGSINLRRS